jgi:hypothetical protein
MTQARRVSRRGDERMADSVRYVISHTLFLAIHDKRQRGRGTRKMLTGAGQKQPGWNMRAGFVDKVFF